MTLPTVLPTALPAAILLACTSAAAVSPPPEQFAANCDAPTYASDRLVCGDPSLRALDARLREAWAAVDFDAVVVPGAWVEGQAAWFRRRSRCAFAEPQAECLRALYGERIAVLEVLRLVASRPPRPSVRAVCPGAPWGDAAVRVRALATDALAVESGQARVLAAATPSRPDGAWMPYVGFAASSRAISLQPIDGPAIVCRLLDSA